MINFYTNKAASNTLKCKIMRTEPSAILIKF